MADDIWTVKRILGWIEGYLREKGDENPRLSAQWLVSDALGVGRMELYLDPDRPLSDAERATLRDYTRRRGAGEPLQYITGTTSFRFITVLVEPGVLIPRPETEVLVSEALDCVNAVEVAKRARLDAADAAMRKMLALQMAASEGGDSDENSRQPIPDEGESAKEIDTLLVADLCTGSGCIACSIATEIPHARIIATDIDPKAVALAKKNVECLEVGDRVEVIECDLGEGIDATLMGSFNLVISNPPYIPTSVMSQLDDQVVGYESHLALDGGDDGLDTFRRLVPFALRALSADGVLAVELHETCLDEAASIAQDAGLQDVRVASDLAGRPRVLLARKRP